MIHTRYNAVDVLFMYMLYMYYVYTTFARFLKMFPSPSLWASACRIFTHTLDNYVNVHVMNKLLY